MKVRVVLTLDVDCEAWALDYGMDPKDKAAIREDVRQSVEQDVLGHFADLGHLLKGGIGYAS